MSLHVFELHILPFWLYHFLPFNFHNYVWNWLLTLFFLVWIAYFTSHLNCFYIPIITLNYSPCLLFFIIAMKLTSYLFIYYIIIINWLVWMQSIPCVSYFIWFHMLIFLCKIDFPWSPISSPFYTFITRDPIITCVCIIINLPSINYIFLFCFL